MENIDNLKFSVSICVYGGDNPKYFDMALESIFTQTLMPNEVVLFVDGPVGEETEKVIAKYEKYDFFKVIRSEKNVGHGNARRGCMENCTYELVALMDADDICASNRFEKQIQAFSENENLSIVGGQIEEFIDTKENTVGKRSVPLFDSEIKEYMKKRCPMNQVTVMFKRTDVNGVGGYIDWYCEEDYYLWIRMANANLEFCNLSENLVYVRVGNEMYRRRGGTRYFVSEAKLQAYMKKNGMIGIGRYLINVGERFILQILIPNRLRGWVFKKFAREKSEKRSLL